MEKPVFEQIGGAYRQQGNYLLPNLTAPENISVGIWGKRHLRYIGEYRKALYIGLQLGGELYSCLSDIGQQTEDIFSQLVKQMAKLESITERLKPRNQILWMQNMNSIQNRAIEMANHELIYT